MSQSAIRNSLANARVLSADGASVTAGGTGDATAVTLPAINKLVSGSGTAYTNVKFVVSGVTTVGASETLGLSAYYETSADNSSWATPVYFVLNGTQTASSTYATVVSGAVTGEEFSAEFDLDLTQLPQYIRFSYKPDLSRSGTDTAVISACVLGEGTTAPLTKTGTSSTY